MRRLLLLAALLFMVRGAAQEPCPPYENLGSSGWDAPRAWSAYRLQLVDLSNGGRVVGVDGISGRVGETVKLRVLVKDRKGQAVTAPVLVRMSVSGRRPGTLRLAGRAEPCQVLSFRWNDRDAKGTVVAPNDLVEYTLGTAAEPVAHLPVADRPGEVRVLWGTTETLQAGVLEDPDEARTLNQSFNSLIAVRPEADPPERLEWSEALPLPSHFLLVDPASRPGELIREDLYFFADRQGNRTAVDLGVRVESSDPRVRALLHQPGPGFVSAPGRYTLSLWWGPDGKGALPSGEVTLTLETPLGIGRSIPGALVVRFDARASRAPGAPAPVPEPTTDPDPDPAPGILSFLNADLRPETLLALEAKRLYLHLRSVNEREDEVPAVVWTETRGGVVGSERPVTLRRVGRSPLFLAPLIYGPPGDGPEQLGDEGIACGAPGLGRLLAKVRPGFREPAPHEASPRR